MTHWYGWAALMLVLLTAFDHGWTLVSVAWRGPRSSNGSRYSPSVFWLPVWATIAAWMVAA